MTQISFSAFALQAQMSSPGGVNHKPVGGPSGACGPSVCATKKRRKPRPVDQLPLPLPESLPFSGVVCGQRGYLVDVRDDFWDVIGDRSMDAPDRIPAGSSQCGRSGLVFGFTFRDGWLS